MRWNKIKKRNNDVVDLVMYKKFTFFEFQPTVCVCTCMWKLDYWETVRNCHCHWIDPSLFSPYRRNSRLRFTPTPKQIISTLPSSAIPLLVSSWLPFPQILSHHISIIPSLLPESHLPPTFSTYLSSLSSYDNYCIGQVTFPPDILPLLQDIKTNNFEVATDGSVRSPHGSFSWLIHGRSSGTQLSGYNTTTFTATPLSSLRTECCGYLGAVLALRALLTHHDLLDPLTPFTARAHIDNQALVKRLSHHHQHSIRHSLHPDSACKTQYPSW